MGGWPNIDCNSQANWDKPEPSKSVNCNAVTDRPWPGGPKISFAADDKALVRFAVRDPKAPCSEFRQQWQILNVKASTRTVNRRLNKAGLKAHRPRRQTFLTLNHRRNRVQLAAKKFV